MNLYNRNIILKIFYRNLEIKNHKLKSRPRFYGNLHNQYIHIFYKN